MTRLGITHDRVTVVTKGDISAAFGVMCRVDDAVAARHKRESENASHVRAQILSLRRRCVLNKDPIPDDAAEVIARVHALAEEEGSR